MIVFCRKFINRLNTPSLTNSHIQFLILIVIITNALGLLLTPVLRNNTANIYAHVAKHIVDTNDWINLFYDGKDWLDKPHFQFWMTALSYKIFGINAFAYVLPGFLFNLIGAFYTYLLGKHIFGEKIIGLLAALFYLSAFRLLISALSVKQEAFLLGEIIPACYYWYLYYETHKINLKYLLLGSVFTAMAMMTKGPFVLLPIFGGIVAILIFGKKGLDTEVIDSRKAQNDSLNQRADNKTAFCFKCFLAMSLPLVFISPELILFYLQFDSHPEKIIFGKNDVSGIRWFFIDSQFGRFFNSGPIKRPEKAGSFSHYFYYLHVFLWAYLPWIVMLPFAAWKAIKSIRLSRFDGIIPTQNTLNINLRTAYIFLFASFLPTFTLFSLTRFQMDIYINILIPFAAILCAHWAAQSSIITQHTFKTITLPTFFMVIISLGTTLNFIYYSKYSASYQIAQYLKPEPKLKLIDYDALGTILQFFNPQNQYKQIVSEEELNVEKKPYYLIINKTEWDEMSPQFKVNNQNTLLRHFQDMKIQEHKKIMLKQLLSIKTDIKKYQKDILLIRIN